MMGGMVAIGLAALALAQGVAAQDCTDIATWFGENSLNTLGGPRPPVGPPAPVLARWRASPPAPFSRDPAAFGAVVQANPNDTPDLDAVAAAISGTEDVGFVGFGPTDEAFQNLFDALNVTAEDMLGPDGIATTADVLNIHGGVPGDLDDGSFGIVTASPDGTTAIGPCNNATILSDGPVCSGMAYVVDTVLLPAEFCAWA
jgi:hypothetical protein